ncbi:MAG TPA: PrgI family protein [Candidatus Saccharimonadales bacterium]|nr:PrgI family protein [Candidatus Saccharimonadales bacterium]
MATYKVIQDIEAEDKLVGPLSLKQFIYACMAAVSGYLGFISFAKGAAYLLILFLPVTIFGGFFAFPWGRDQPTELWALAKIRFFLKPRRRIWDQSGVKELVTVTAPKKIERVLTNNLSQTQVESRLTALASTLDSRGWAIKNVNINLDAGNTSPGVTDSDRLVGPSSMPQQVSQVDVTAGDDMLDERNNSRAFQLSQLMNNTEQNNRERLIQQMRQPAGATLPPVQVPQNAAASAIQSQLPAPAASQWFARKPLDIAGGTPTDTPPPFAVAAAAPIVQAPQPVMAATPIVPAMPVPGMPVAAEPTEAEQAFAEELLRQKERMEQTNNYGHMRTIQPLGAQPTMQPSIGNTYASQPAMTPQVNPATIELAKRNDLTISTLANIANKQDEHPGEVIINLHDRSTS